MSYSCLEELQVDLDLHTLDKTIVLSKAGRKYKSKAGRKYKNGWFVVTDDGVCHLFDEYGNLDDIKKITQLEEKHIRRDITKIALPDSIMRIKKYAFWGCTWLTSVTIPDSVTSIGTGAFFNCSGLMSVMIGNGVSSIMPYAFNSCISLTSVTIPDSVTSIGYEAFRGCSGLTSVTIPNSVTSIGTWAFCNCGKLTNLTFKDKTLEQVKKMKYYPWGIEDESIIHVE